MIDTASKLQTRPRLHRLLLTTSNARQNTLLLGANLLAGLCIYAMHSGLGHLLGPTTYGTVASLIALSTIMLIPTHVVVTVVTRYGSTLSATEQLPQLHDLVRRLTALLLPVGCAVMVTFVLASGYISSFLRLGSPPEVAIIGLMFAVSFVNPVNIGTVLGLQRFGWYSFLLVLPVFLRCIVACGLVLAGFGIIGAIAGIVLADILSYSISFRPLSDLLQGPRSSIGSLRPLWPYSITAMIVQAAMTGLYSLDTILAKHFLSTHEAGLYAAVATAGRIVFFASNSVTIVMFPKFAARWGRGTRPTRAVMQALATVFVLSLIVEGIFALAPSLVMHIMFGPVFSVVASQLLWYGWGMLFFALAQVFVTYFLTTNHHLYILPLLACCVVEGVLFNMRHGTAGQLVQDLVIVNGLLLVALTLLFVLLRPGCAAGHERVAS